jgi:hypothetical protein
MERVYDFLSTQFKLYYYLNNINSNLIQYLDNNNINIDYYCCAAKVIGNNHYLITSDTTKNKNIGRRIITIDINTTFYDNQITCNLEEVKIYFEDMYININISQTIADINAIIKLYSLVIIDLCNQIEVTDLELQKVKLDLIWPHSRNINELCVLKICNYKNLNNLHMFQNLLSLEFSDTFNKEIKEQILPESLQTLIFGTLYNQYIEPNILPKTLRIIKFGEYYNKPIKANALPEYLEELLFCGYYNLAIDKGVLPPNLKIIRFNNTYNKIIGRDVLPTSLKTIQFGTHYGKIIPDGVLPDNISQIIFINTQIIFPKLNLVPVQHRKKILLL